MLKYKTLLPLLLELRNVLTGSYPAFVWQRRPGPIQGHVPVFSSHEVESEDFEEKLRFLKHNGYRTVTSDDVYEFIAQDRTLPEKSIMLSFDDGRKSVWTIAYPLLKKYGFRAVVFLTPEIVRKDEQLSPHLGDVWQGKITRQDLFQMSTDVPATLSWNEIRIMHESGLVDFQSHGLDHRKISIDNKVVAFVTPELIQRYYFEFDIPYMDDTEWSIDQYESILGAPIYGSAPFLSEKNRLIENRELKEICVHYVMQSGKEDFFQRESWETQLRQIVSDYRNSRKECDLFETQKEQQERIVLNLQQAKTMIETKLDNLNVRHLAYPWGAGSPMAIRCSQQMGIVSNFWATISNKSTNLPQSDPFRIVRHKHDFIWRLPGEGRKSLKDVFLLKLRRRARGQIDY